MRVVVEKRRLCVVVTIVLVPEIPINVAVYPDRDLDLGTRELHRVRRQEVRIGGGYR